MIAAVSVLSVLVLILITGLIILIIQKRLSSKECMERRSRQAGHHENVLFRNATGSRATTATEQVEICIGNTSSFQRADRTSNTTGDIDTLNQTHPSNYDFVGYSVDDQATGSRMAAPGDLEGFPDPKLQLLNPVTPAHQLGCGSDEIQDPDGVKGELEYHYCDPTRNPKSHSVKSVGGQDQKVAETDDQYFYAAASVAPMDRSSENLKPCHAPASTGTKITMTESEAYGM